MAADHVGELRGDNTALFSGRIITGTHILSCGGSQCEIQLAKIARCVLDAQTLLV